MKESWADSLYKSKDGAALNSFTPESAAWITDPEVFSKLFRRGFKHRSNLMSTRARKARWKSSYHDVRCWHGCSSVESLQPTVQSCHNIHSSRVARHGKIVKLLVKAAERQNRKVLVEPQVPLAPIYIKPDIIILQDNCAIVVDVQVCGDTNTELKAARVR